MAKQNNTQTVNKPLPAATGTENPLKKLLPALKLSLILGLISFLVYANTLSNGFALDDYLVIKENTLVNKGIAAIPELLSTSYHHGFNKSSNELYRPLSLIVFATVKQFCDWNTAAYHFINVLVFACCVVALFLFLHQIFERKKIVIAFIASLLFALHPVHTEVVANCKGLDELLCFLFAFLSLNALAGYVTNGKPAQLLSGAIFFLLSFLAKETAVTFLAMVPIIFFLYRNENKKRSTHITIAIASAAIIVLAIRYNVLNSYHHPLVPVDFLDNPLTKADLPLESRVATAILIGGYYVKLLFLPYPLISDYSYNSIPFAHFTDVAVLASLAVYVVLIALTIKLLLANRRNFYALGLSFFLVTLSLFSNIFFLIGANMAERFLFFPSVGFCLIVALLFKRWVLPADASDLNILKTPKLLAIIIPLSLVYTALTFTRNSDWKDNYTLFSADIKKAPNDARLSFFLGNEMTLVDLAPGVAPPATFKEGISYLQNAIAIYPAYLNAYIELGRTYCQVQDYDKAEQNERKALQLEPGNALATNFLGSVYLARKQYTEAIDMYTQVLRRNPDNLYAHFNIAAAYANIKDYPAAITELNKSIALNPAYTEYKAFEYLVRIYKKTGKPDSARLYQNMMQQYKN